MVRPGVRVAAGALAAAMIAGACGAPAVEPAQALEAFRALASRPDLTYRFELATEVGEQNSTTITGAVAGSDSAYRVAFEGAFPDPSTSDMVISGDQAFRRSNAEPWEATKRPVGLYDGDLATFLPLIGSAQLTILGRVDYDGASRIQLAIAGPIPLAPSDENEAVITRLEVLIGDDGTPVRAVAQIDPIGRDLDRATVQFLFADFGAKISIQSPVIP